MKTILAPTDFSNVSLNAIEYSVEIAKLTKAKIILFHTYHVPLVTSDFPVVLPSLEEMEKDALKELKKIEKNIFNKHGRHFKIECICKCGFLIEEIRLYLKENKTDLIIMGMQGAGYLSEKLIGSNTTSLMHESKCPVLAIDKNVKFKNIKKIALACDYKEIKNGSILEPLKEFVRLFKSHVYVLNVVRELETTPAISDAIAGIRLEHALEDVDHTFHFGENENVVEGINEFVTEKNMDMVVMIPRKHSLITRMFVEPKTKQVAFHARVPVLSIHE